MVEAQQTFGDIERIVEENSSESEQRRLQALRDGDIDQYRDAVTELYMQMMFRTKIERVINRGKGHDRRKPGSHKDGKHK